MLNWIVWNRTDHLTECKQMTDIQLNCLWYVRILGTI